MYYNIEEVVRFGVFCAGLLCLGNSATVSKLPTSAVLLSKLARYSSVPNINNVKMMYHIYPFLFFLVLIISHFKDLRKFHPND